MASRGSRTRVALIAALLGAVWGRAALAQDTILLHSREFVPPPGLTSANKATLLAQPPTSLPRVYALVQMNGVPTSAQANALRGLGLVRVASVPNRGWIASLPRSAVSLGSIAAQPSVRSVVPLVASDRISPEIRLDGVDPRVIDTTGNALLELRIADDLPVSSALVFLLPHLTSVEAQSDVLHTLRVRSPPGNVAALAALGFVLLVDEAPPPGDDDNDHVRTNTRVGEVQIVEDVVAFGEVVGNLPGDSYALDGAGVLVGQWETGRADTCHPDFQGTLAPDGSISGTQWRVTNAADDDLISDADCREPTYDPDSDLSRTLHATHVAGTIVGNGAESEGDGWLPLQFRGMAPNAEILAFLKRLSYGAGGASAFEVEESAEQYAAAAAAGMVLANNSWSYERCHDRPNMTCYELGSEHYDRLVLDPGVSLIASAGNEGDLGAGFGSTGIPNSAKNTIVVGNIESDTFALSLTSSRGPVDDGRIKPDLVAPGDQSGLAKVDSATTTNHVAYPYVGLSGTSMSAPAVTGAAALLVQQIRTRGGASPWPSTLKALLLHSARDLCCTDLAGDDVDTAGPDYAYGYGALDARAAIDLARDARGVEIVEAPGFAGSGSCATDSATTCDYDADGAPDDDEYLVDLPAGLAAVRATLVWDDLPQTELLARRAPALRNDLDLFLVAPDGTVHRPWRLDRPNPADAATRGVNAIDNVEVVDVDAPATGTWRIVVRPTVINPSDVADPAQRYSLVYPAPGPDVMVRDTESDDGGTPSARHVNGRWLPGKFWDSPDVIIDGGEWVRAGEPRDLHVIVTNTGAIPVGDAVAELFFARQGIGLDYADFLAHPIGTCALPELAPGQSSAPVDCLIPYTWDAQDLELGDDDLGHVCLLARVTAGGDGVTFPGRASIPASSNPAVDYVPWDNNLAQQNLALENARDGDGDYDVDVHNPSDSQARAVQVHVDSSALPSGWSVQLAGGPVFSLPAGGAVATHLQITPTAAAQHGASGRVVLHGVDTSTGALLSGVSFTLVDSDRDGDAVRDAEGGAPGPLDNCADEPNASQSDADADARGDACECGDLSGDGLTNAADPTRLRQALAAIGAPLSSADLRRCSVIGSATTCNVVDASVLRRALQSPPLAPGLAQTCAAAGGV